MPEKVCGNCKWWSYDTFITLEGQTKRGVCNHPSRRELQTEAGIPYSRYICLFTDTCPLWAEIGETDE